MIHICFCFRDKTGRYAKFAGTSMLSLLENSSTSPQSICLHILHDETLTQDNRNKFIYLAGRYGQLVKFYNVAELCADSIAKIKELIPEAEKSKATVGAFYKLLIPQVLSPDIERAIFIDPDTIVNLNINELWQIKLDDKVLGAMPEVENDVNPDKIFLLCKEGLVKGEDYFNSGVMLMNLNVLRGEEENIMRGVKFRGENPKHNYFEQTILNYCFSTRVLKLPAKFNRFVRQERRSGEQTLGRKIFHYASGNSRMGLDMKDPANRLWMDYFIKSPWFDEEAIGRLYTNLQKIRDDLKDSALKFSRIESNKTRTFFVAPGKIDSLKKTFSIRDDEEIIPAENEDSLQKLLDTMKTSQGKCLFFIMTEKFLKKKFPFDLLKREGFVEDKDFVKAWAFTKPQGESIDSYSLIQSM